MPLARLSSEPEKKTLRACSGLISSAQGVGVYVVTPAVQSGAALRCAGQHDDPQSSGASGPVPERCDHRERNRADRPAQAPRHGRRDDVAGHVGHVVGHDPGGRAHAAIGEQDDLAVLGDAIDESWIPEVEVAPEVLQAQDRRACLCVLPKRR